MTTTRRTLHRSDAASSDAKQTPVAMADQVAEDGRTVNHAVVSFIREQWVEQQMREREEQFTEYTKLKMMCGTWNVNAKKLDEEGTLAEWLRPHGTDGFDIYAVGFQEIVDLNAVNVAMDNKSNQRSAFWAEKVVECLAQDPVEKYEMVVCKHLVGILLVVCAKAQLVPYIQNMETVVAGVGVMGVMGNKGAVAARMKIYDSTVCFVCSHLAAHRDNVAGRNSDYHNIISKIVFTNPVSQLADLQGANTKIVNELVNSSNEAALTGDGSGDAVPLAGTGILDHDHVFWVGDLNYRIDDSMSVDDVFAKVQEGDIAYLRARDQLNIERGKGTVFSGFNEGLINFLPTYKFQPGTDEYEQRPEKKLRAPAWCDRILWKSQDSERTRQLFYRRAVLRVSDHKPVFSGFECDIRTVVAEKQRQVYQEIMRMIDKWENETIPKVEIDGLLVEVGEVQYMVKQERKLQIRNTGNVIAHFRFVPKLEESTLCKRWVSVFPTYGMLIPGEVAEITAAVFIDNATAHMLNSGTESLEDIVILRLENGRDFYITLSATYARSCYGCSLAELVSTPEPMRFKPLGPPSVVPPAGQPTLSVPKELWRMIDFLYKRGFREKDLFVTSGRPEEVHAIREALDKGEEFADVSSHSMAEALVTFLESLDQPIISEDLYPAVEIDMQNIRPWSRRFLEHLPPLNYNVLVYVLSLFREVLQHREHNKLTAPKLSLVCCKCFTREPAAGPDDEDLARKIARRQSMQTILSYFITTTTI